MIGSYPSIDGGFEAQANGNLTTASSIASGVQSAAWTRTASTNITATITGTGGRSGPKYFTWSSTNASAQRANSPTTPDNSIANSTSYVIQYYYRTSAAPNLTGYGISPDATSNTSTATSTLVNTGGVWTKAVFVISAPNPAVVSPRYGLIQPLRTGAGANGVAVDLDDVVLYAGSAADVTPPSAPGAVTATGAVGGVNVSWGASANTDGGGYVVVRYAATAPDPSDDPNQNGIYAAGNSITVVNTGTVRYIGTGTSFTDNAGITGGTDYYYKVYTVDKAFNYSAESVSSAVQATPAYFYYNGTGSLAALSSWGLNANGTGTAPSDFTSDAQTFEIRNTTAVSTDAPWTVSGTNSKVVLGNTSVPSAPVTLTITAGNPITTNSSAFEISAPSSSHHTIIYRNPTVLSIGTSNDPSLEAIYDGITLTTATAKTYGNLSLINNADVTFSNSPTVNTLTVNAGSSLTATSTANIIISSGGSVTVNGIFRTARQPGFTGIGAAITFNGVPALTLGNSSLIDYNRAGTLTQAINALPYANLTISNTSPKQFEAGSLKISGTFTITATNTLNAATSSIEFNGSAAQSVPAFAFNNLTINNAAGITLAGACTVSGALGLTNGLLQTTALNILTLDVSATVTGGSSTSYISGPVNKLTNTAVSFSFPVGKGGFYRPATVTPSSTAAGTYTAEYFHSAQGTTTITSPLTGINTNEYWEITKNSGPDASVSLNYNSAVDFSWSGASPDATSDITIAHLAGASWQDEDGAGAVKIPGTSSAGVVTSQMLSSFSPFTFGVKPAGVVAVTEGELKVKEMNKTAVLTWISYNESGTDRYEMERSSDAISFTLMDKTASQHSSSAVTYKNTDPAPLKPVVFYRLKVIGTDGSFRYSNIVSLKISQGSLLSLYPNPVQGKVVISYDKAAGNSKIDVINTEGITVKTIFVGTGTTATTADMSELPAGNYYIRYNNNGVISTSKMLCL